MGARFVKIGEPAHDAEQAAIAFLVAALPPTWTVYGNPWLVDRDGVVTELDAVVLAPHAIFVVECKAYRGAVDGTDHDWYVPHRVASPLKLSRKTAQVLATRLKDASYDAGRPWVQELLFLSLATAIGVKGPASKDRIHTRKTIIAALQDESLVQRLSGRRTLDRTAGAPAKELQRLLTGVMGGKPPVRSIREFDLVERIDAQDAYSEVLAKNRLSGVERLLRIYAISPTATAEQRDRRVQRARWEAQVLGRIGRVPGILSADPPFEDEAGIVLPFEHFPGMTLATWVQQYGPRATTSGGKQANLTQRTDLWIRIARAMDGAHQQGVVHRLLRPEVILVEDRPDPQDIRITGFDLAKQLASAQTISLTTVNDDRLVYSAPEVIASFSSAEPASDQFSLGAILGILLTGRPLFESTRSLVAARKLFARVRDVAPRTPLSLDEAVVRMLALRPPDRYPTIGEAIEAVRLGRDPEARSHPTLFRVAPTVLDPDNLEPETRVGTDYEIVQRLGQGGMATVYAARHLVSGRTRALKVARAEDTAEQSLRDEYHTLVSLDHQNIVRVLDLTKMVEGRLTLVMERVGGETLRQWLAKNPTPDAATQRRLAEDLLAGLDYLEQKGITHKDLKPDNLLVGDGHLTIIDFSLVKMPADAPYGGTALYRDPSSARWSASTDRYAAALCLFELYAGRHAFDGAPPEPGQEPSIREEDIDPPGLAPFFRKALTTAPESRFTSAQAMRDALRIAIGQRTSAPEAKPAEDAFTSATPLRRTPLSPRAVNALSRSRINTIGELLALTAEQVRALHAIGTKTAADIVAFQQDLRARGLEAATAPAITEPAVAPGLTDSPEPIERLPLQDAVKSALRDKGLVTIGAVAGQTRTELLNIPGMGRGRFSQVIEALHEFSRHADQGPRPGTLDSLWERSSSSLKDQERTAIERWIGLHDEPQTQAAIAKALDTTQPQVSSWTNSARDRLDAGALADPLEALDTLLDGWGGIANLEEIGARLEEHWPSIVVTGAGMVRLLALVSAGRARVIDLDELDVHIVARARFDHDTLKAFCAEVQRLAKEWPPLDPQGVRRTLESILPDYHDDPLALAVRVMPDIETTEAGHLFVGPIAARDTIQFVIEQLRETLTLDTLIARVKAMFGPATPVPSDQGQLLEILRQLECRVQGDKIVPTKGQSILAERELQPDPPPTPMGSERTPEEAVRDMLRDAAKTRGFRMLVTPPESHAAIGRSVAKALGAMWISFEDEFFKEHGADLARLERAERFAGQREDLTDAAEQTFFRLVDAHAEPGHTFVLGDTALFGTCEALDLPRRLYDDALEGNGGFWVVVIPGVIHSRQPYFNEKQPTWHLEGSTLPLMKPLPED